MILSEICVKRPVFTIVLNLAIVILGGLFYTQIQIRDLPDINIPIITVTSSYMGAEGGYMEQQVTKRIEDELKTIENLDIMTSSSSSGLSKIILEFYLEADIEKALNDVRNKVSEILYLLPQDMDQPIVSKMDIGSIPSIWITVQSDKHSLIDLTTIVDKEIKSSLEALPSVGEAKLYGSYYRTMNIEPIAESMRKYNVSPIEIEQIVRSQNKDFPLGVLKTSDKEYTLRLNNSLSTIESFKELLVKRDGGVIVKLGDVANVSYSSLDETAVLRYNGNKTMAVGVIMQSDSNILDLSKQVYNEINAIQKRLPKGINMDVAYDRSIPVQESIKSIAVTILEAVLLVSCVIYLFLGSLRITFIPLITIPISLIGALISMSVLNFSLNIFTLLSMILAIGLVVDDSIVVLENSFRHYEDLKKNKIQAAVDASKEVGFAVVAMTLTLASVFFPVGFISGKIGILLIEFSWTLAFCVIFSGIVSLTLSPMLSSQLMKRKEKPNIVSKYFNSFFETLQFKYMNLLQRSLLNKKIVFFIAFLSVGLLVFLFKNLNTTFIPQEDDGMLEIHYEGVEGMTLADTDAVVTQSYNRIKDNKNIEKFLQVSGMQGSNTAFGFVDLISWKIRKKSQEELKNELFYKLKDITDMSVYVSNPTSLGGGSSARVSFYITSNQDYDFLEKKSKEIIKKMSKNKVFTNIKRDFDYERPTVDIIVDKNKLYQYDVTISQLAQTLRYVFEQNEIGDFILGNEIYDVVLRYNIKDRSSFDSIESVLVKNNKGQMLPVSLFITIKEHGTSAQYAHYNNYRAVNISSDLGSGYMIDQAFEAIEKIFNELEGKMDLGINYRGEIKDMQDSSSDTLITFGLALVFIYLILAAQFESFIDPFIILFSVPFSITGAVFALYIFGDNLNIYSNIGLIALIGLVTKNAIMLIEFSNQLQDEGVLLRDAILKSANLRLRPILMTSIATIVGAVPLTFAQGSGAASRNSIGLVIVGGMLLGTIFTLFVIPILCDLLKKKKRNIVR